MIKELNRNCPICGNKKGKVLHNQSFILDSENPLPSEYDIVCCVQCNFVYADVEASQEAYNEYYQSFSKYESIEVSSGGGTTAWDKKRLLDTSTDIMENIKDKNLKILDIGAAMGGLLDILKQNKYKKLYALEPSKGCVEFMINEYGLNAFQGGLFDDFNKIFSGEKFDFIILSHVFEHIYDLYKAIVNIKSILNSNAKIYIEVPDASRYSNFYVVPYSYFDIEHINHFTNFSLLSLMGSHGFQRLDSKEKIMPVSNTINYPACYSVFELDNKSKDEIQKYIDKSKKNSEQNLLLKLISSKEECIVWGAGSFTKRLLSQTNLSQCNIKYFVDKDIVKQGKYINGIKIVGIDFLKEFRGAIVVASEIVAEIKSSGFKNTIIVIR